MIPRVFAYAAGDVSTTGSRWAFIKFSNQSHLVHVLTCHAYDILLLFEKYTQPLILPSYFIGLLLRKQNIIDININIVIISIVSFVEF